MAGWEVGAVGKDRKERNMRKDVKDEKKGKIGTEKVIGSKKVAFRDKDEVRRKELEEVREELRKEIKKEIDSIKEEWMATVGRLEDRMSRIENRIGEIEEGIAVMSKKDRERDVVSRGEGSSGERSVGGTSTGTGKEGREGSRWSKASEGLSGGEIISIRKWIREKEKVERANNIVIKGIRRGGIVSKEGVKEFLKEKLGIDTVVIGCRVIGSVIIAKMENGEAKEEVMCNKSKLKGENLFIENDLTWEERKIQERIYKWVRREKEKGREVKAGYAKVRVEGKWVKWEDMERKFWRQERNKEEKAEKERNEERLERREEEGKKEGN